MRKLKMHLMDAYYGAECGASFGPKDGLPHVDMRVCLTLEGREVTCKRCAQIVKRRSGISTETPHT